MPPFLWCVLMAAAQLTTVASDVTVSTVSTGFTLSSTDVGTTTFATGSITATATSPATIDSTTQSSATSSQTEETSATTSDFTTLSSAITPSPTSALTTIGSRTSDVTSLTTVQSNETSPSTPSTTYSPSTPSRPTVYVPTDVCRPRWVVFNGLTSSKRIEDNGGWVSDVPADTVADCLDECARHVICVAVEVNQTESSLIGCSLVFNTTLYANISSWYSTPGISTYVIEPCPEQGLYSCRSGYVSSAGGVGSTGGSWVPEVSDLDTCQLYCSLNVTCVGVDYDWQSTSCFLQTNATTFNGRRYTIGPASLIQYTKVDACINTCWPSWKRINDVSSLGSVQIFNCSLTRCLSFCIHTVNCVGIEHNGISNSCSYFPSSAAASLLTSAKPTPFTVQYRLKNFCEKGCVVTWKPDVGFRYTLLNPIILRNASTVDQCALYCRQSSSCTIYQVTRPSSAPVVCTIASDYIRLSRVADVMIASYLFTEVNCTGSARNNSAYVTDSSNTCVAWTVYHNSYVPGGVEISTVRSLSECQLTCVSIVSCKGVDYNPQNPPGQRCYIIKANSTNIKEGDAPGISHFAINRTCTGCTVWTKYTDSNVFGGTVSQTANNLTACQRNCLNTTNCTGIDFNPGNPSGWRCFLIFDSSASITVNVVTGINHYDITENCPDTTIGSTSPVPSPGQCVQMWTFYNNSNVAGAREVPSANSLSDCQSACYNDSTCRGIDFNGNNAYGWRCFIQTAVNVKINLGIIAGVRHYDLNKNCNLNCRTTWTTYRDSNVLGGLQLSTINSLSDCLSACSNNLTCTGIDYNANNSPGQRCFIFGTNSGQVNAGKTPGVNHFQIARNCCSLTWVYYGDSNMFDGWLYPQPTPTVNDCQVACLQNSTCSSIDVDGSRCYIHSVIQPATINIAQARGVQHFELQPNC